MFSTLPIVETLEQSALSATDADEDHVALATFALEDEFRAGFAGETELADEHPQVAKTPFDVGTVHLRSLNSIVEASCESSIPTAFGFKTAALPELLGLSVVLLSATLRAVTVLAVPGGGGNGRNPAEVESTGSGRSVGFSEGRTLPPGS